MYEQRHKQQGGVLPGMSNTYNIAGRNPPKNEQG